MPRPVPLLPRELKARLTVVAKVPAVAVETVMPTVADELLAARPAMLPSVSFELAEVAVTARASWKAASVTTRLFTSIPCAVTAEPTRALPKATVVLT